MDFPHGSPRAYSNGGDLLIGLADIVTTDQSGIVLEWTGWQFVAWDVYTGEVIYTSEVFPGRPWDMRISPDGTMILVSSYREPDQPDSLKVFSILEDPSED